jgi:hypothetical protein
MIYDKLYILRHGIPDHKLVNIDDWDIQIALAMISKIEGAYAFRFQRRLWEETKTNGRLDITAKIIKESGTYYVNGFIETLDDIRARIELNRDERRTQDDAVLLKKMEQRGSKAIVKGINNNWCCFFDEESDFLL